MTAKPAKWQPIFEDFIGHLRIHSKEEESLDEKGNPLKLWESQKRFLSEVSTGLDRGIRSFYILKSRQLGCTTISLAIDLFWLAMHPGITASLVTDNEENRDLNRSKLREYMNSFPEGYFGESFQIIKGGDNRLGMKFSNGSSIAFKIAGTKQKGLSWAEGSSNVFNHLTEIGKYGNFDAVTSFEESFSQSHPHRLNIWESTGNGFNAWSDIWKSAKADLFTKHAFFIGWWSNDTNRIERSDPRFARYGVAPASGEEREKVAAVAQLYGFKITPEQIAWYRWRQTSAETSGGDLLMLDQNQPWTEHDAFVQTGYSFFQTRQITKDLRAIDDAPEGFVEDGGFGYKGYRYELGNTFFDVTMTPEEDDPANVELRVWEEPQREGRYVIGCDPAWGRNDHKDCSAISVWRCFADKLVQVAEYATADVEVKHCAWVLAHLAGAYEDCIVNYEVNGPGNVIKLEWDNLRGQLNAEMNAVAVKDRNWENALANARWYLYARPDSSSRPSAIGTSTTFNNKSVLMHQMRGAYVTSELMIRSRKLLGEMHNVVQDGSSIGAPESRSAGGKDDRVFAAAFAIRAWMEWFRPSMLSEGMTYRSVTDVEKGDTTPQVQRLNSQVFQWLKTQDEIRNEPPRAPKWKLDRGLA